MHDKLLKQSNCRGGVGEGEGWSFDCVSQPDISHELLSEADHDIEGYSDCERADYGKQNLSFMSEYL